MNKQNQKEIQLPKSKEEISKTIINLHLISDATGETLVSVGRAVSAQYKNYQIIENLYILIRNNNQLIKIFKQIEKKSGIVLYTTIKKEISEKINSFCQEKNIPCVAVLEPILHVFQKYLGEPTQRRASAQHDLNAAYYKRIDALDYTLNHDDGQMLEGVSKADVILIGISRTSKTPTSLYLANRGIKTANIPLVQNIPIPQELLMARKNQLVVGLVASPEHISQIRKTREKGLGIKLESYTNKEDILNEIKYAKELCMKQGWPIIDVTQRSIEETAAEILSLFVQKKAEKEDE